MVRRRISGRRPIKKNLRRYKTYDNQEITINNKKSSTKSVIKKVSVKKTPVRKNALKRKVKNNEAPFKAATLAERLKKSHDKEVLVSLRNVKVEFGKGHKATKAIDGMSFDIYRGEVFGLVGESGSGKSTTGNAILGLVDRKDGSIKVKGHEVPQRSKHVKGAERDFLVENVQMIFQDPASSLNPYKTIRKVVEEGLDNIDIKKLLEKSFDIETASVVIKIAEDITLNSMKDKKLHHFVKMANEGSHKAISDYFDNVLLKEMKGKTSEQGRILIKYLELRKQRKIKILSSKNSKSKLKEALVLDVIKSVGLSEASLNRYPLEFSGGQQQRVGISRALVLRPELLIADEPISALDVSIQAQVVNIFNDLKEVFGLTFLFIAHDLRMVEYISDRIAVMYKGKLLEIGSAKDIIENPIHPYTKSLTGSIPSINDINKSLISSFYDPRKHNYSDANIPQWFSIPSRLEDGEHYVYGSHNELAEWTSKKGGK